ncbi:MAG: hypothetical protein SWQ30_07540 [Thermodesulfobacteriota bacterium]|nr:hypothetical protein [Thermodesulfobacteriota bacterium]
MLDKQAEEALSKMKGGDREFPWWNPSKELNSPVKLQLSLPTYDNKINLFQNAALRQALANSSLGERLEVSHNFCGSDSLIPRARDKMAATFLASDAEWQLQLDSDIIFPTGTGPDLAQFYSTCMDKKVFNLFLDEEVFRLALSVNAIDEILRSGIQDGKKIVGGLYFWRGGVKDFSEASSIVPTQDDASFGVEFNLRPDNYVDTDKLATGFLLTHRCVYQDIAKHFSELEYDVPNNIPDRTTVAFYNPNITEEEETVAGEKRAVRFYRSEDYAFAWRAKQVGYEPCLNMNILLGHMGNHVYSWFDRHAVQKSLMEAFTDPGGARNDQDMISHAFGKNHTRV